MSSEGDRRQPYHPSNGVTDSEVGCSSRLVSSSRCLVEWLSWCGLRRNWPQSHSPVSCFSCGSRLRHLSAVGRRALSWSDRAQNRHNQTAAAALPDATTDRCLLGWTEKKRSTDSHRGGKRAVLRWIRRKGGRKENHTNGRQ